MAEICYRPIGLVHSKFKDNNKVPIQSIFSKDEGVIEIYPEFLEGLKDLDGFSHIYLIYHFHLSKGFSLKVTPFLNNAEKGVFSTRAPKRPNNIGLSILKIKKIEDNRIYVLDIDVIDKTPVLDIKPYVSLFDNRSDAKDGWFSDKNTTQKSYLSDNRFLD